MKNRKVIYGLLTIIAALGLYIYQLYTPNAPKVESTFLMNGVDLLPSSTTDQIARHSNFTLSYNEAFEQAEWVAYELNATQITRTNRKRPYFIYDSKISSKSANYKNYKNSGYDKGHLCPAGDRKFSKEAYDETFLTSNITPQRHDFNSGIWNRLEQKTRYWATKDKSLYVVTGGVLKQGLKTIGHEKVAVPDAFYKILLDFSEPEIKAIAFLIPHKDSNLPLYTFVVSIDEIERLTGIDFFPNLPDDLETTLERSSSYKAWSF